MRFVTTVHLERVFIFLLQPKTRDFDAAREMETRAAILLNAPSRVQTTWNRLRDSFIKIVIIQGLNKGNNRLSIIAPYRQVPDFLVHFIGRNGRWPATLGSAVIKFQYIVQSLERAIMHIRSCFGQIAQAAGPEQIVVVCPCVVLTAISTGSDRSIR